MNAIVKYQRSLIDEDGNVELTFSTPYPIQIEKGKEYIITLKEHKPKRSLQQNKFLWSLINQICLKQDGNLRERDELYGQLLKMSGAKFETISCTEEALKALMTVQGVRAIEVINRSGDRVIANLYVGSSNFDTAEMNQLIDTTLNYASEVGIETEYWKEILKG